MFWDILWSIVLSLGMTVIITCFLQLMLNGTIIYDFYHGKKPDIVLSYKDFIKYYNTCPKRYSHNQCDTSGFLKNTYRHLFCYEYIDKHYRHQSYLIGFNNIIDMFKANFYVKHYVKNEKRIADAKLANEKLKEYLSFVQKDIDNLLNTSEEQINEAKKITEKVNQNLTETKMTDKKYIECENVPLPHIQEDISNALSSYIQEGTGSAGCANSVKQIYIGRGPNKEKQIYISTEKGDYTIYE